jgi:multidrug resistance protein
VVEAKEIIDTALDPRRTRTIIILLALSVGLMMTGFGIIMPVFARRLDELGSGVQALGFMTMSFALAQFVAAPFLGSLADRRGRRPIILLGLGAFSLMNVGFLLADSTAAFIAVRTAEGALSAGLFPAAMGVVADIVPENQRAKWVGYVMGSYGIGFIFGPMIGGLLFDTWGFAAPFVSSAVLAAAAFVAAFILVPETRTPEVRRREQLRVRRETAASPESGGSLVDSLPKPLYVFATLLLIDFIGVFAFAFVEPQMIFYFYDELDWSTIQFGIVVGVYGLAMVLSQTLLGQTSDRLGRKPVIIVGLALTTTFYFGLAFATSFAVVLLVAAIAGAGGGLTAPAMSAYYFDITASQHRSRVMGIKESTAALGGVTGPLLVVAFSTFLSPQGVFITAGMLVGVTLLAAIALLREPEHAPAEAGDVAEASSRQRALSAQASLRGVVMRARVARDARSAASTLRPRTSAP